MRLQATYRRSKFRFFVDKYIANESAILLFASGFIIGCVTTLYFIIASN